MAGAIPTMVHIKTGSPSELPMSNVEVRKVLMVLLFNYSKKLIIKTKIIRDVALSAKCQ